MQLIDVRGIAVPPRGTKKSGLIGRRTVACLRLHKQVVFKIGNDMPTTTRGRKSAAKLQIVALESRRKPPEPPADLTSGALALWKSIVSSLPADFFRPGDLPLLQAYVTSADRKRQVDAMIVEHGMIYDGKVHLGLKISRDEGTLMASLAVKLRLCQSARTRPESAQLHASHAGMRPWDTPDTAAEFFE